MWWIIGIGIALVVVVAVAVVAKGAGSDAGSASGCSLEECPNCDNPVIAGSRTCPHCGFQIRVNLRG